jgi:hypothetical protein
MNGQTKIGQNALVDESTTQNQCDDGNDDGDCRKI